MGADITYFFKFMSRSKVLIFSTFTFLVSITSNSDFSIDMTPPLSLKVNMIYLKPVGT